MPRLTVFEHETLRVGPRLSLTQFEQLVAWQDRSGARFFSVGRQRLTFRQYVGVLQIGALTLEILPKLSQNEETSIVQWQRGLLGMLHVCYGLKLFSVSTAAQRTQASALLEVFLDRFLSEVEALVHEGLVARYRHTEANLKALRGRLDFAQHINQNHIHRERFWTIHEVYDHDHLGHQVLKAALSFMRDTVKRASFLTRIHALLLSFEKVQDRIVLETDWEALPKTRQTVRYEMAWTLARMILAHHQPVFSPGKAQVLALLFDMNQVFEQYIFHRLRQAASQQLSPHIQVQRQISRPFWASHTLRPDLLVTIEQEGQPLRWVLDTKWKTLKHGRPDDADLRQIYAYNLHFGAAQGMLIYPKEQASLSVNHPFMPATFTAIPSHSCRLAFVSLFKTDGSLNPHIGQELLAELGVATQVLPVTLPS